ncbi:MAG: ABC transporter permease [Deltaproteobacteria bacterium]|nr:ABC transporter permease [Deltaproteobacteria bacterium]
MQAVLSVAGRVGGVTVRLAEETGGLVRLLWLVVRSMFPWRVDGPELVRNLFKVGVRPLIIVVLTALFVGALMVIQTATYVRQFGAYDLIGWGAAFATFREVGPILIGLMFSGRVGANNTAELGTMKVTEQIDALRTLSIDPIPYLVTPRFIAMVIMLFTLTVLGDVMAVLGGMVTAYGLIDLSPVSFWNSLAANIKVADFMQGLYKAAVFGGVIALVSCKFGLSVTGGARGVGRAVNDSVVTTAVGIFVLDYVLTFILS